MLKEVKYSEVGFLLHKLGVVVVYSPNFMNKFINIYFLFEDTFSKFIITVHQRRAKSR